jgi:histone demethylase JARID1
LKIARGKVKDDEKYTCPICDWRVRIPRDAARPKLEDLQSWQDEIPNLPFQPEEEEILAKIIDNAQEFRNHVAPFCNPVMATVEEVETQRFYLRKIEGAEILLAYETNFFRQELHKYSPVASEPPPILEASKSTRKPRPTKLQKLMQQHGVDDPEQLPQNLRTKPHTFKRKSSEPQSSRPPTLQPAPGRSESGTPTSHSFPPTASMHHGGPTLSGLPTGHDHAHPSHFGGFPGSSEPHFTMSPPSTASPAFAPHPYLSGGLQSPGFGGSSSSRQPGMFNEAALGRHDAVLGGIGSGSPMRDPYAGSSSRLFDDLTHQNDIDEGPKGEKRSPPRTRPGLAPGSTPWAEDEEMDLFFDGEPDEEPKVESQN